MYNALQKSVVIWDVFGSGECADNAADTIVSEERYMWHKRDFQLFCFPTVNKQWLVKWNGEEKELQWFFEIT